MCDIFNKTYVMSLKSPCDCTDNLLLSNELKRRIQFLKLYRSRNARSRLCAVTQSQQRRIDRQDPVLPEYNAISNYMQWHDSQGVRLPLCVFITAVPVTKLFAWGEGDSGGHVLRETTSAHRTLVNARSDRSGLFKDSGVCVYTQYLDMPLIKLFAWDVCLCEVCL